MPVKNRWRRLKKQIGTFDTLYLFQSIRNSSSNIYWLVHRLLTIDEQHVKFLASWIFLQHITFQKNWPTQLARMSNATQQKNIRILFIVFCQSQNIALLKSGRILFPLLAFPATYIMKSDRWKEGKIEFCTLTTTCCEMGRGWPLTSSIEKWCSNWIEYCNTTHHKLPWKMFIPDTLQN